MSKFELSKSAASLEAASKAAAASLGLEQNGFEWFAGEVRHSMPPQKKIPEGTTEVGFYSDNVTFYGGGKGNLEFGHIQAFINEPLPEAKHQAREHESPRPYIPRLLTYKGGIITVDTPTTHAPLDQGPVVVEGSGHNPQFRKTTLFNTKTGEIKVKGGELVTDGRGWGDDRTIEIDAAELPDNILSLRIATMERTIKAAATIFERIAWRDDPNIKVGIEKSK